MATSIVSLFGHCAHDVAVMDIYDCKICHGYELKDQYCHRGNGKVGSEVEVRRKVDDAAIDAAILGVEKGLKKQSAQEEKPQQQKKKKKEKETLVEEEKKTEEESTVVDIKKTSQKKHVDDGAIESAILDRKDGSQVAGKKNDVVEKDGKEDEEDV
eukprot:jgi/Picre1/29992/NNA_005368.t1